MQIDIDPEGDDAPYVQLANRLREDIADGAIIRRVPSQMELEEASGLSRNTVKKALDLLKDEGLIKSRIGRGMFVVEQPAEEPEPPADD
jgi:DNA-binding GntR family transcriptional regulator